MTAFGGALTDPTKIMGARIGAFVIDAIVAAALIFGLSAALQINELRSLETPSSFDAQQTCNEINRSTDLAVNTDGQDTTLDQPGCFAIGRTAWFGTQGEVRSTQTKFFGISVLVGALNYVVLTAITGASVGKLIFGLRVVTARGQRAGFGRNTVRSVFLIVDQACCFLPGLLTSFNSKGHRRIGDMVGGTYVVHRSAEGRLLSIPGHLVVKGRHEYGSFGPAPVAPEPTLGAGGGIDAPVFDPSRNTYVRYDQDSGVWFEWDDASQTWVPARQ